MSFPSNPVESRDQARGLRALFDRRVRPGRRIAIVGPDPPGAANLAANVAMALGAAGRRVVLVETEPGPRVLSMALGVAAPLMDAVEAAPGVRIAAGGDVGRTLASIRETCEFVLVVADPGAPLPEVEELLVGAISGADGATDAYGAIRRLVGGGFAGTVGLAVLDGADAGEAERTARAVAATVRQFLGIPVALRGAIPRDDRMKRTLRLLALEDPGSPAGRALRSLAERLAGSARPPERPGFWGRMSAAFGL